jgi:hypothetical protein
LGAEFTHAERTIQLGKKASWEAGDDSGEKSFLLDVSDATELGITAAEGRGPHERALVNM